MARIYLPASHLDRYAGVSTATAMITKRLKQKYLLYENLPRFHCICRVWSQPVHCCYDTNYDYAVCCICCTPQIPCADPTGSRTASLVTRYSWYLVPIPLAAAALDATSWMFAVEGTAFNAYLLYHAYRFQQDKTNAKARDVFKASLWHLPAMLALFVFHSRRWLKEEELQEEPHLLQRTRARLKGACIHEIIQTEDKGVFCPVVVAEEAGEKTKEIVAAAHTDDVIAGK